jgi:hypothetical protein
MTEETREQAEEARRELEAKATPADKDTEQKLRELDRMVISRRKDPEREREYERLRDEMAAQLAEEGPRYYIDDDGVKRYAFTVQPEPVEVDVDGLLAMYEEGTLSREVLDAVAPRKVDKEQFRRATAGGKITQAQLLKVAKIRKGTAHVKFSKPADSE